MPESQRNLRRFYIDGRWQAPLSQQLIDVVDPATEAAIAQIAGGGSADVDAAVAAARRAFPAFAQTTREQRIALLQRIEAGFQQRKEDLAQAMCREMGAP